MHAGFGITDISGNLKTLLFYKQKQIVFENRVGSPNAPKKDYLEINLNVVKVDTIAGSVRAIIYI